LPVTTADGSNHNRVVDPLTAQHATIARGANALKYGASTLGGAISFTSATAFDSPAAAVSLNGGSHGQRLARVTAGRVFDERFDGLIMLESKSWDGYREHNRQERRGVYANAGWQITDTVAARLYATVLQNDQELPGTLSRAQVETNPDRASEQALNGNYQINVDTWRLAAKSAWQVDSDRRFEFGVSVEEQSLFHPIVDRVLVDFDGPGPGRPVEVFSLLIDEDLRDVGTVLRYEHRIGQHDLLAGFNYASDRAEGGNYRNLGGIPNGLTSRIDNSAELFEAFAVDRVQLTGRTTFIIGAQAVSARRDVRTIDAETGSADNPADDYSSINPRVGLIYEPRDGFSLYTSLSRLFEPPTNYELQDNVAGGDATLDAMEGTVIEAGTRGQSDLGPRGTLEWDIAVYYARIENEILSVEDPEAPGTSLATNVDDTVHAGVEGFLAARIPLARDSEQYLEPRLSFTVNEFHFDDDANYGDNRLPAAPRYVLAGEVMWRGARGFHAGPTFELAGRRYADFANRYSVDSYALLGLRAGFSGERWSVYADVRNLLDESYIANHSVRNIAAPGDPILNPGAPLSAYLGIRYQIP
ncbi:MAG TPA: TonB-dependent receptor, partial [Rhodothermales bacterium]